MRILVTNDDGINAYGLQVAEEIAHTLTDDVWVVAPASEHSGASHSLTLTNPVRLRALDERHFALTGTPTDCVMFAVAHLLKDHKPDLVLSGVNPGVNVADDITYSGTVAGATEGCMLGIPAIALSQGYPFAEGRQEMRWDCVRSHGPALLKRLLDIGWPKHVLLNVNFPDCSAADVAGIAATHQGKRDLQEVRVEQRVDLRDYPYYWIGFRRAPYTSSATDDLNALMEKKISVTPLQLDLTEVHTLEALNRSFSG